MTTALHQILSPSFRYLANQMSTNNLTLLFFFNYKSTLHCFSFSPSNWYHFSLYMFSTFSFPSAKHLYSISILHIKHQASRFRFNCICLFLYFFSMSFFCCSWNQKLFMLFLFTFSFPLQFCNLFTISLLLFA